MILHSFTQFSSSNEQNFIIQYIKTSLWNTFWISHYIALYKLLYIYQTDFSSILRKLDSTWSLLLCFIQLLDAFTFQVNARSPLTQLQCELCIYAGSKMDCLSSLPFS